MHINKILIKVLKTSKKTYNLLLGDKNLYLLEKWESPMIHFFERVAKRRWWIY